MIQTMSTTDPYLTMRHLRERGWTERLVRRFLGNPDDRLPNTYINGGSPQRLFLASRVKKIECDDQSFIAEKIRSQEYSFRLQGARDSKRQSLATLVRGITLPCLSISFEDVLAQAVALKKTHSGYQFQPVEQVALTILLDTMKSPGCQLDLAGVVVGSATRLVVQYNVCRSCLLSSNALSMPRFPGDHTSNSTPAGHYLFRQHEPLLIPGVK